jgi:hypothetical protein
LPPDPEWTGREDQSGSGGWTDPRGDPDPAAALDEIARSAPSLPIILISAAAGVSAAVICFYFANQLAGLGLPMSAAAATLGLSFGLGGAGGFLSWATGSRAAAGNIALSCVVILLVLAFFGLCVLAGAIAAALLLAVQL